MHFPRFHPHPSPQALSKIEYADPRDQCPLHISSCKEAEWLRVHRRKAQLRCLIFKTWKKQNTWSLTAVLFRLEGAEVDICTGLFNEDRTRTGALHSPSGLQLRFSRARHGKKKSGSQQSSFFTSASSGIGLAAMLSTKQVSTTRRVLKTLESCMVEVCNTTCAWVQITSSRVEGCSIHTWGCCAWMLLV